MQPPQLQAETQNQTWLVLLLSLSLLSVANVSTIKCFLWVLWNGMFHLITCRTRSHVKFPFTKMHGIQNHSTYTSHCNQSSHPVTRKPFSTLSQHTPNNFWISATAFAVRKFQKVFATPDTQLLNFCQQNTHNWHVCAIKIEENMQSGQTVLGF